MFYLVIVPEQGHSRTVVHNENIEDLIHFYHLRFTDNKEALIVNKKYLDHSAYIREPNCNMANVARIKPKHDKVFHLNIN